MIFRMKAIHYLWWQLILTTITLLWTFKIAEQNISPLNKGKNSIIFRGPKNPPPPGKAPLINTPSITTTFPEKPDRNR